MPRVAKSNLIHAAINAAPNSNKARDLKAWLSIAQAAHWKGTGDLLTDFPNATSPNNRHWTFPLPSSTSGSVEALVGFVGVGQIVVQKVN